MTSRERAALESLRRRLFADAVEPLPGEDAGVMPVAEPNPQRVSPDFVKRLDRHTFVLGGKRRGVAVSLARSAWAPTA